MSVCVVVCSSICMSGGGGNKANFHLTKKFNVFREGILDYRCLGTK